MAMSGKEHALALLEKMTSDVAWQKRSTTEYLPFPGPWPGLTRPAAPPSDMGDQSPRRFHLTYDDLWARDWHFYVSRYALDALDIAYTNFTRTENVLDEQGRPIPLLDEEGRPILKSGKVQYKKRIEQWSRWTQGSAFCFDQGMIFYDTPIPDGEKWGESLQRIKHAVKVLEGVPAEPAQKDAPRKPGRVRAQLYATNAERTRLEPVQEFETTQDDFLRILINGQVPS